MNRQRVLTIVLAGGRGSRLDPLTVGRAKPSLPVGGTYRLIDVVLSNAVNSGLSDLWLIQQYEPHLLNEHVAGGRPWDLDRSRGGLRIFPPYQGGDGEGFAGGNADALARHRRFIANLDPELVLVTSADHLYKLDLFAVCEHHRAVSPAATIVTTELGEGDDRSRFTVVETRSDGTVGSIAHKPEHPRSRLVASEVFVYDPEVLLSALDELLASGEPLGDYAETLLPAVMSSGRVIEYRHHGHWRDLGTPRSYLNAQLELLEQPPPLRLDDPDWPIISSGVARAPARIEKSAVISRSWVSPGAVVGGSVHQSIVGPGVIIERDAVVRHSVLMDDTSIRAGAEVSRAVLAECATVGKGCRVGAPNAKNPVLIGAGARVRANTALSAGTQIEPPHPEQPLRTKWM